MNSLKKQMVESQLLNRGIFEEDILEAFKKIDREEFIPPKYRKFAYVDLDIPLKTPHSFVLRPYCLARIIQEIKKLNPERILIVGDESGHSTAIFQYLYGSKCYSMAEEEILVPKETDHLLSEKFDVIFFSSKVYGPQALEAGKNNMTAKGQMFYLFLPSYEEFKHVREAWYFMKAMKQSSRGFPEEFFSWNILLKEI